ncbi:hypothetical protein MB02_12445 [Croceicoccus estronivorus]|uniref:RidA family protein n=1 Tax=Croceicoccus estronivorus TaxID=1172626 RepID=UPI000831BAF5|nr:RidA family protein [Croceicoccus estronivorus]OCC23418.1 hypothetical protein MB02_12445 [Croceicoccus estronivorus]
MSKSDNSFQLRGETTYTHARAGGHLILISGTVSWDDDFKVIGADDFAKQVKTIYGDLARVLEHFELDLDAIVRETVYTTSMERLIEANGVRMSAFGEKVPPASTWIEMDRLANRSLLLEIEAVAAR